jgi:hypothetical protein
MLGNVKYFVSAQPTIAKIETAVDSNAPKNVAQQNTDSAEAILNSSETNTGIEGNEQTVLISPDEQTEVARMLNTIDPSDSSDYNERITKFQKQHSLSVTGVLDAQTLGILIQQAKLQKTYQRLNP